MASRPRTRRTTISAIEPRATIPGAAIDPDYRMRRVTYYPVDEGDMDSLTHINSEMAVCLSLGTFFLGVLGALWIGIWLTPPTGDPRVTWVLTLVLVVLVLAAAG